jgi:hypothetical protein
MPRGVFRAALLCGAAAIACLPRPGFAQETSALRGEVSEAEINKDLLGGVALADQRTPLDMPAKVTPEQQGIPTPAYRPTSEGATPDAETEAEPDGSSTAQSIFDEPETDDGAFGDEPTVAPAARPTTAQAREAARKQENEPAQSAAGRLEAERQERDETAEEEAADITGTVRAATIDSENEFKTDPDAEREEAIEALDRDPEENPYAPVGIRVGTFIVTPSAESGLTWTSNANSSPDGGDALLSESTLRLNAISEHGGDQTTLDAFGNFRKTISGEEIDETRAGARAALERDLGGDWTALASLGYEVGPESATSPTATVGTLDQPITHTFDGSLGIQKDVGRLQLRLTGNVEREVFGDAELSTGGTISQADQDSTLGTVVLRTGYEISPALTPFVELEYGQRIYDQELDSNGFARSSTRTGVRGGVELDFGEKFSGELSAGWINDDLEDPRLAPVSGPTVAAALLWSPYRGTAVNLDALTTVEDATTPGESGSILYSGEITLARELRANLIADIGFGAALRDYTGVDGQDVIWNAEAGMTWWFNRYLGLSGKARHEEQTSTLPDRNFTTNSVFLGIKMQR